VVTVYECGLVGDQVFIAMEYVPGGTLRAWLTAARAWREIVGVFVAAGRGLAAAHDAGLVHRDFKPENVLVGDDERVRVVDFGLADEAAPRSDGAVVGTPAYMAPEQHDGGEVDARTDQFAFGIALWEALSSAHPLAAANYEEVRERARSVTLEDVGGRAVPGRLRAIAERATRANPDERFPSMDALLAELTRDAAAARRRMR
jgi:serine/threonine protein kinase